MKLQIMQLIMIFLNGIENNMKKILHDIMKQETIHRIMSFHIDRHNFYLKIDTELGIKEYIYVNGELNIQ